MINISFLHQKATSWKRWKISGITAYDWWRVNQTLVWMAPTTELTCTWADHLHQCSRFHHSCIYMQGALQQVPQWLQEQKPGIHRVNNNDMTPQHHTGAARHMWRRDSWTHNEMQNNSQHQSAGSRWTQTTVYLRHIHWSQTRPERSPVGRRRCSRRAGGDRGDCTRSYRGWVLKRGKSKQTINTEMYKLYLLITFKLDINIFT